MRSRRCAAKVGRDRQTVLLLNLAADAGFEVLVTNDRSIERQQNLTQLRLGIVVLGAPTNKIEDLLPLAAPTSSAIRSVQVGEIRHVTG